MSLAEIERRKALVPQKKPRTPAPRETIKASAAIAVVALMGRRVSTLRTISALLMVATMAAVLGGIALIFFAGELAAQQRQSEINALLRVSDGLRTEREKTLGDMKAIDAVRSASDKELSDLNAQLLDADARLNALPKTAEAVRNNPAAIAEAKRAEEKWVETNTALLQAKAKYNSAADRHARAKDSLDTQKKQVEKRLTEIDAKQNEVTDKLSKSGQNLNFDYNSTLIRVVAVFLIMFLVQTFITIFRYTMRLGAYYQARIDALKLMDGTDVSIDDLQKMTMILSPETYDFGKTPKTPAEQAIDLAKEILRSQQKRPA